MKENQVKTTKKIIKIIKLTLVLALGVVIACSLGEDVLATNYSVVYHSNFVSDMPVDVSSKTSDASLPLSSTTPARDGFVFNGWCTTLTLDGENCIGTQYTAGSTFNLDRTAGNNNLTLYAMWGKPTPTTLYGFVAAQSKGKNTDASSGFSWWTAITADTSGVYELDDTDSNGGSNPIYFYRGILDNATGSYGSDGDNEAYPNTVVLSSASSKSDLSTSDTCWRIVRTTSTGGVKMIYQGTWTGSTCANATTNAQTKYNGSSLIIPFSLSDNQSYTSKAGKKYVGLKWKNIHAVSYTYSTVAEGTTTETAIRALFGANGNDTTTNSKSSIVKQYIEDWYASTLTSYTSKLEGDAGYCQDRRIYTSDNYNIPLGESTKIVPYGTSGMTKYYFGAYVRNGAMNAGLTFNPLLTCPRGKVDLYSYAGNAGNGNGQLAYPVALLTADEASFAGSGGGNGLVGVYSINSFLVSGSDFWLLSSIQRYENGTTGSLLLSSGQNSSTTTLSEKGARPVISLKSGTSVVSGSGTATDPWVVNP